MRRKTAVLVAAGAALAAGLGVSTPAFAGTTATAPVTIDTAPYVCGGVVCSMGVGDVGLNYESDPIASGGPTYYGPESSAYVWTLVSGSLPAGLKLVAGQLYGVPTKAGTSTFTLQASDLAGGSPVEQTYSITIGTGSLDRIVVTSAVWNTHISRLTLEAFDANTGATLTITSVASGAVVGTMNNTEEGVQSANIPQVPDPGSVTITSSLGGSVTVPLTVVTVY
jgi:hypothetical protein